MIVFNLLNIVLHRIQREEKEEPKIHLAESLLDSKNPDVVTFVKKLIASFNPKKPSYGTFESSGMSGSFQELCKKYHSEKADFLSFTEKSTELLRGELNVPSAKGGYVIFTHYQEDGHSFLLTVMLDKSDQFTVGDEKLDIKKLQTLDIDRLARACRLNFQKWDEGNELYLEFIKGTRDVSIYFRKFIGCDDLKSAKKNSENLKNAIDFYFRESKVPESERLAVENNISKYIASCYKDKSDVKLATVSSLVKPDQPDLFSDFVEMNRDLEVSGSFSLDKPDDFKNWKKITLNRSGVKLEFDKNHRGRSIQRYGETGVIVNDVFTKEDLDKIFN